MSNKVKVELNYAGFNELRKSDEVKAACAEVALNVLDNLSTDYKMEPRNYPDRSGYAVMTANIKGYNDNLKNNTLLKALHV